MGNLPGSQISTTVYISVRIATAPTVVEQKEHRNVSTPSDGVATTSADPGYCVLLERCAGGKIASLAFVHDVFI